MSRKRVKRLSAFAVYKERKGALKDEQCDSTTSGEGEGPWSVELAAKKKELRRKRRGRGGPFVVSEELEGAGSVGPMSSEEDSSGTQRMQREAFNRKKRRRIAKMMARSKRAKIKVAMQEVEDVSCADTDSDPDACMEAAEVGVAEVTLSEEDSQPDAEMVRGGVSPLSTKMVQESVSMEADIPFFKTFKPDLFTDSEMAAKELFKLLIKPFPASKFFQEVWEQRPMVLQRHKPYYNDGWFSSQELDSILRQHHVEFSTNIDLTTYEDGERQTHNPAGRATAHTVWEHFKAGCSVRLLNPQTYSKTVWLLNSTLQELFNSVVGANTYLTPAGSQGFSPHYDDIEAFVMQLEGRKKWKLYKPRSESEFLPQSSSGNFTDADIGEPILEVVLEAGDLLYFPRGFIHQASTPPDTHSLHITVSTYQRNTWSDLFEKLLPAALEIATAEDREFRAGLPLDYLRHTGIVHSDSEDDQRREVFLKKISHLFGKLLQYAPVDGAADQMGVKFLREALPPCVTKAECSGMVCSTGTKWDGSKVVGSTVKLCGDSMVRLFRSSVVRLVMEKDTTVLYSCVQNTRCPQEKDMMETEIEDWEGPGIDHLIEMYPRYVTVDSLPMENGTTLKKVDLCDNLYQLGLLVVQ